MKRALIVFIGVILLGGCVNDRSMPLIKYGTDNYNQVPLEIRDSTFHAEVDSAFFDNHIYDSCKVFLYNYHRTLNGDTSYFRITGFREWELATKPFRDSLNTIREIRLSARYPNESYDNPPQSPITYEYLNLFEETRMTENTGVIENYRNIRIHTPRNGYFLNLFVAPWPSVLFPLSVGKSWKWNWSYDMDTYSHDLFFQGQGIAHVNFTYEVIDKQLLTLDFGRVETYVIKSTGISDQFKVLYNAYFNSELGFVKIDYSLPDGSVVQITMSEYYSRCE